MEYIKIKVEYFFNDLSFHGQFNSLKDFREAVSDIIRMKDMCQQYGFHLKCSMGISSRPVTGEINFMSACNQELNRDQQRLLLSWITRSGPFWENSRKHPIDELLECNNEVVTDSIIGEGAFINEKKTSVETISVNPSDWLLDPLVVTLRKGDEQEFLINIRNHYSIESLEKSLTSTAPPLCSWTELEQRAKSLCKNLIFIPDAFSYMKPEPFNVGVGSRILERILVLEEMATSINAEGKFSKRGEVLYNKHFVGEKAWFSDSSSNEKIKFQNEMTFEHPTEKEKNIFCSWHGKVKTPQIRIHFTWPSPDERKLFVAYIGPKITKR